MTSAPSSTPRTTSRAGAWIHFVRERFQIPALLLVGVAQGASAQFVITDQLDGWALVIAVSGLAGLLATMRLMDELKDVEKDRVAHPDRPLARGLISEGEAKRGLVVAIAALGVGVVVLWVLNPVAGGLLGVCVAYSLLMYREFFVPDWLESRPFWYAVSHQVVLLPMYAFATAAAVPAAATDAAVLWFGLTGLGASFTLEVCRKLDPAAHPVLRTYLSVSGPARTFAAAAAATLLAAVAAVPLGVQLFVWPAAGLLLVSLVVVARRPDRFALPAVAATLLVVVQVLAPTLTHVTGIGR